MSELKFDRELDIQGEVCPYTFVRSKLILEQMEKGQILKVIVDHPPAIENVPRSMQAEGNKVLGVEKVGDRLWHILVEKA